MRIPPKVTAKSLCVLVRRESALTKRKAKFRYEHLRRYYFGGEFRQVFASRLDQPDKFGPGKHTLTRTIQERLD